MLFLQRNYRFFYMFISTSTILCVYVFVFSWINILHQKGGMRKAMSHDILSDVLIVYCFIAVWFVGGLTVFHFYLICTNQVSFLLKFLRNFINWKYIDYFFLFATDCDIQHNFFCMPILTYYAAFIGHLYNTSILDLLHQCIFERRAYFVS